MLVLFINLCIGTISDNGHTDDDIDDISNFECDDSEHSSESDFDDVEEHWDTDYDELCKDFNMNETQLLTANETCDSYRFLKTVVIYTIMGFVLQHFCYRYGSPNSFSLSCVHSNCGKFIFISICISHFIIQS